jgi:enamine deaminase RidA (YjgF/YER057c/UK114 family)
VSDARRCLSRTFSNPRTGEWVSPYAWWCNVTAEQPQPAPRDIVVPADWRPFYDETHIPAAIWTGNTLRLTGHTGENPDGAYPDDVADQIRGTFRNIASTLAAAGLGWAHVVEINSYHVGYPRQADAVLRIAAEFLTPPYPAWTAVGVAELYLPEALVEIRCVAVAG